MHTLLDLSGAFAVILLAGVGLLAFLRLQADWTRRRRMQGLILALPLVSLLVVIGGLHHVVESACSQPEPLWDHVLDVTLLSLICTILFAAGTLGIIRLVLMKRFMRQKEVLLDDALQTRVNTLTAHYGIAPVRVRLSHANRPFALLYGLHRPTILLSTWMKEHLDEQELEAVLAHELGHLSRSDYLINWLATMLRDAFFFLPTSRVAYRQFRCEKELACDDLVVQLTHRPLALASALTKVWLHQIDGPPAGMEQSLAGSEMPMVDRVERLLGKTDVVRTRDKEPILLRFGRTLTFFLFVTTCVLMLLFALLLMNC